MAQDINNRMDELSLPTIPVTPEPLPESGVSDATEFDLNADKYADPGLATAVEDTQPLESVVDPDNYPSVFVEGAEVKVAGLKDVVGEVIKKFDKTQRAQQTKELKQRLNEAEKLKDAERLKKKPKDVFNPNNIADDESLANWIEANAKLEGLDKIDKISYKKIAAKYNQPKYQILNQDGVVEHISSTQKGADQYVKRASKEFTDQGRTPPTFKIVEEPSYSEEWVTKFLDPQNIANRKTIADPREVFKAFKLLTDVSNQAYKKGEELVKAINNGTDSHAMRIEFQQLVALEGVLGKKVKGIQVDLARSLGILGQARKASDINISRLNDEALQSWGGPGAVDNFAKKYIKQKDQAKRTRLAEETTNPWWKRVSRIIPTTYTNNLISGIPTHLRNILGYASLSTFSKIENIPAYVIGPVRIAMGGKQERLYFKEIVEEMNIFKFNGVDAFAAFWQTFRHNKLRDRAAKIDMTDVRNQDAFKYDVPVVGKPVHLLGLYTTISGRVLSAEDEFMKAVAFARKIRQLSVRARIDEEMRLVDNGVNPNEARKTAQALEERLLLEPTDDMIEQGIAYSRYLTQTTDLTGIMRNIEKYANNPAFKLFGMFLKVTNNIIGSAVERVPILGFATPRTIANLKAGGIRADLAISRQLTGGTFMWGVHTLALDGRITGGMPVRTQDRNAMIAAGWQPYSIVFETGALSEAAIERFKKITNVSVTKDKIYISYQGIEPISILVAMAATTAELSMLNPQNDDTLLESSIYGMLAATEFVSEHPLLNGLGRLMSIFTNYDSEGNELYDMLTKASEEYGNYFIHGTPSPIGLPVEVAGVDTYVAPLQSSFWRNVEKMQNPTASNWQSPTEMKEANNYDDVITVGMSSIMDGWDKAVRKACAGTPECSDLLPRKRDPITGAHIYNGMGNLYDLWSPFKVKEGIAPSANNVISQYGANYDTWKEYQVIDGVQLSGEQIDQLILFATRDGLLAKTVVKLGEELKDLNIPQEEKRGIINTVISEAYSGAKEMLIANDANLRLKMKIVKQKDLKLGNSKVDKNEFIGDIR